MRDFVADVMEGLLASLICCGKLLGEERMRYWEPFFGCGYVATEIVRRQQSFEFPGTWFESFFGSDINRHLIVMIHGLQDGSFQPVRDTADLANDEAYAKLREQKEYSAVKTFVGYSLAFQSQFFQSKKGYDFKYFEKAATDLEQLIPFYKNIHVKENNYDDASAFNEISAQGTVKLLIYCDPPYKDTTQFGSHYHRQWRRLDPVSEALCKKFETDAFWEQARKWVRQGHIVIVSELEAPEDFIAIDEVRYGKRIERLFVHETIMSAISDDPICTQNKKRGKKENQLLEKFFKSMQ